MRQNAPHLVHDLAFIVPNYSWWEAPFYGIGLKLYDLLAGKFGFGPSKAALKGGDPRTPARPRPHRNCEAAWSTTTASSTTRGSSSISP